MIPPLTLSLSRLAPACPWSSLRRTDPLLCPSVYRSHLFG